MKKKKVKLKQHELRAAAKRKEVIAKRIEASKAKKEEG